MDLAYTGYLLFVVPGFCLVWTYRHFTKAPKIGEFEYAVWSLLWGAVLTLLLGVVLKLENNPGPTLPLNNPAALLGGLLGISLAIATGLAFPLGFLGASISDRGFFAWIDKLSFKLLAWISKDF